MPDPLVEVRRAARAHARAAGQRNAAIRAAHAEGASLRQIAAAAGISHTWVAQIVAESKEEQ